MNKVIADMTNKGIKNIADLSVDAFIDLLIKRGSVNIGDNEYKKQELLKIWNDIAKDAFKTAAKNIKKTETNKPVKSKTRTKKNKKRTNKKRTNNNEPTTESTEPTTVPTEPTTESTEPTTESTEPTIVPTVIPPAVNVFELRIDRVNGKGVYVIADEVEDDWQLFADKDSDCHEIVNNTMPILPDNAKFGDIVEWTDKTGYRMTGGVYQIGECNGQLVLKDIEYGYDDYGCIASFVNAAEFPDSWETIDLIQAYPHGNEHSVAVHIESLDLNSMHIHHSGEIRISIVSTLSTLGPKFLHLSEEKDIDKTKRKIIDMKLENKCIYVSVNQYVTEEDGTKTKIFRCDLDLDWVGIEIDTSNTALHWEFDENNNERNCDDFELTAIELPVRNKPTKPAKFT